MAVVGYLRCHQTMQAREVEAEEVAPALTVRQMQGVTVEVVEVEGVRPQGQALEASARRGRRVGLRESSPAHLLLKPLHQSAQPF